MTTPSRPTPGRQIHSPHDPISQYNLVVTCYNTKHHQLSGQRLESLPPSRVYSVLYRYTRLRCLPLLLVLFLVPVLNLVTVMLIAAVWMLHERALRVHAKNQQHVPNPFENMLFGPQVCSYYRCNNKFLNLETRLCPSALHTRTNAQGLVPVMFYNEQFRRYFFGFERKRWRFLLQMLTGVLLCILCLMVLYPLVGLDLTNGVNSLELM